MPYAEATEVPVSRSKAQLEAMLKQRGAEGFASGWDSAGDTIQFHWRGLIIRFHLPKVDQEPLRHDAAGRLRKGDLLQRVVEQKDRSRWRALYLVVKAKLEAVESGIAVFEEEFLAFIVDPQSGRTVGEVVVPRIQARTPLLLEASAGSGR